MANQGGNKEDERTQREKGVVSGSGIGQEGWKRRGIKETEKKKGWCQALRMPNQGGNKRDKRTQRG